MSDDKVKEVIDYLPNASQVFPVQDEKFLFCFEPKLMDVNRFLFCLSVKTGTQVFSAIMLIQALSSFFDMFSGSFLGFFVKLIAFGFYFIAGFYTLVSTLKNEYLFARVGYLFISIVFIFNALCYIGKTLVNLIKFITPWESGFLHTEFLIEFFGYGIFLFIYLYLIYVLYHYMLELKNPNNPEMVLQNNENEEVQMKNE